MNPGRELHSFFLNGKRVPITAYVIPCSSLFISLSLESLYFWSSRFVGQETDPENTGAAWLKCCHLSMEIISCWLRSWLSSVTLLGWKFIGKPGGTSHHRSPHCGIDKRQLFAWSGNRWMFASPRSPTVQKGSGDEKRRGLHLLSCQIQVC